MQKENGKENLQIVFPLVKLAKMGVSQSQSQWVGRSLRDLICKCHKTMSMSF